MTTGAPFIDYFLSDPITTTPFEANEAFTEKQLYLSTHYIVNDYAQVKIFSFLMLYRIILITVDHADARTHCFRRSACSFDDRGWSRAPVCICYI
jgi:hypothetical protein